MDDSIAFFPFIADYPRQLANQRTAWFSYYDLFATAYCGKKTQSTDKLILTAEKENIDNNSMSFHLNEYFHFLKIQSFVKKLDVFTHSRSGNQVGTL